MSQVHKVLTNLCPFTTPRPSRSPSTLAALSLRHRPRAASSPSLRPTMSNLSSQKRLAASVRYPSCCRLHLCRPGELTYASEFSPLARVTPHRSSVLERGRSTSTLPTRRRLPMPTPGPSESCSCSDGSGGQGARTRGGLSGAGHVDAGLSWFTASVRSSRTTTSLSSPRLSTRAPAFVLTMPPRPRDATPEPESVREQLRPVCPPRFSG